LTKTGGAKLDIDAVLGAGAWFSALPSPVATAVRNAGRLSSLPAGSSLFEQDGAPSGLHAVLTGELWVSAVSYSGDLKIVGIARPGDWVGFLSSLDGRPHAYSGVAQQDMQVFSLSPGAVEAIFEQDVATFRSLLSPELDVARQFYRFWIEDIGEPHRRIAARIIGLGRWAHAQPGTPLVPLEGLKQDELAMSVKLSRQTVNAALRDLQGEGLIELGYGRIRVLDPGGLERIARFGQGRDME